MTQLETSASRELATRPSDEHLSLPAFRAAAEDAKRYGKEVSASPNAILFSESEAAPGGVILGIDDGPPLRFTHFSLSQVTTLCGTSPAFLARVKPLTRARVLNEALPRSEMTTRNALVDRGVLRAFTSDRYSRLWDADILGEVKTWLLDAGWIPAVPTINRQFEKKDKDGNALPSLFRGDRDSFQFYYSPKSERPDLGGLRRGVVVYNSEVGAKSFGFDTFLFRDVCANFLIWGASQMTRRRARHMGNVRNLFRDFRSMLQGYSLELDSETGKRIEVAAKTMFAGRDAKGSTGQNAAQRLVRQYDVGQKRAGEIVFASMLPVNLNPDGERNTASQTGPLDYFAIANGASYLAHEQHNADDKEELAQLAGMILADGSAS